MRLLDDLAARRHRHDPENGQATTEFALILIPLLILVVGIIQFGIGLNYWLDMNRLANQGARWAVVNAYPGCPRTGPNIPCSTTLQRYIACQRLPNALKPTVTISFPPPLSGGPAGTGKRGEPVQVTLSTPYNFSKIMNIGTITLTAKATMRIEQDAGRYGAGAFTPTVCP